jgi:hypothetical protein
MTDLQSRRRDVRVVLACVSALFALHPVWAADYNRILPEGVQSCLDREAVRSVAILQVKTNPYYLRGDFDGDGRADYAVAIVGRTTGRNGIALCNASGFTSVLRGDARPNQPFSDMPDDNFLSGDWCVLTRAEALRRVSAKKLSANLKGEVILMPWDDADGIVYFDGQAIVGCYCSPQTGRCMRLTGLPARNGMLRRVSIISGQGISVRLKGDGRARTGRQHRSRFLTLT